MKKIIETLKGNFNSLFGVEKRKQQQKELQISNGLEKLDSLKNYTEFNHLYHYLRMNEQSKSIQGYLKNNEARIFFQACKFGNYDAVQYFLSLGTNPNLPIGEGDFKSYPILEATKNIEVLKLLLNAGVNVNVRTKNDTYPIFRAIENDNQECMELLLRSGVDMDIICPLSGSNLLMSALFHKKWEICKKLIDKKIDTHYPDKWGDYPITCAIQQATNDIKGEFHIQKIKEMIEYILLRGDSNFEKYKKEINERYPKLSYPGQDLSRKIIENIDKMIILQNKDNLERKLPEKKEVLKKLKI